VDNPTSISRKVSGAFDTIALGWTGTPAIDRSVYQFVATDGSSNFSGYSNPRLDRILDEERITRGLAKQKALYDDAFRILVADKPIIYLVHRIFNAVVASNVQGAQLLSDVQLRVAFAHYR
jgi:peptide/nickel transport system substrate-binding protein